MHRPVNPAKGRVCLEALTEKQKRALSLAAIGYQHKNIAELMGIRVSTVKEHLHHAKTKLGVRTIPHAVALAISTNQITTLSSLNAAQIAMIERETAELGIEILALGIQADMEGQSAENYYQTILGIIEALKNQ